MSNLGSGIKLIKIWKNDQIMIIRKLKGSDFDENLSADEFIKTFSLNIRWTYISPSFDNLTTPDSIIYMAGTVGGWWKSFGIKSLEDY